MILPTPSAWRYTHRDETMRTTSYSYEDVKPENCSHTNYIGMFTAGQLDEYGQTRFDEGVSSIHTLEAAHARDLAAYELTVENLTAERDIQSKAADHWMGEACAEHNRNVVLANDVDALNEKVKALEADAERYQLLSRYLISDDCQHDDAIVAARTVDQLNAALAAMKEPR